jgi:hypothetical protein
MVKLLHEFITWLQYRHERLKFKRAKRKANRLASLDDRTYHVLKIQSKYYVFNKKDIKTLKAKKVLTKDLDFLALDKVSVYKTKKN